MRISNWVSYRVNDTHAHTDIYNNWLFAHHNKSNIHFASTIVIFFLIFQHSFHMNSAFSCEDYADMIWYGTERERQNEKYYVKDETREEARKTAQNNDNNNDNIKKTTHTHTQRMQGKREHRKKNVRNDRNKNYSNVRSNVCHKNCWSNTIVIKSAMCPYSLFSLFFRSLWGQFSKRKQYQCWISNEQNFAACLSQNQSGHRVKEEDNNNNKWIKRTWFPTATTTAITTNVKF